MTTRTMIVDQPIYGQRNGVEVELPASWRVEVERFPAESHPDDPQGRGYEFDVRAILLTWNGDRSRAEAVQLWGLDHVKRQEEWVATICDMESAG